MARQLVATPKEEPSNLRSVVEQAITRGASVEVVEKLLELQERYDTTQARKAFNLAIASVREHLPAIVKDRKVDFVSARGHTSYKYEDLSGVVEALSPVLAEQGLSFRWRTKSDAKTVTVTCILSHAQGHSEETELCCTHDDSGNKNAIQAIGSAVTYLQRYTLKAAIGVAAASDDDGQATRPMPAPEPVKTDPRPQKALKTERSQFGVELLAYCNHDKVKATAILMDLTGKASFATVTEDEARAGRQTLRDWIEIPPQVNPEDDDIPPF